MKWTESEIATLKLFTESGKTLKEIAAYLKRSVLSVQGQKQQLGIVSPTTARPVPQTPEERNAGYWREECQRLSKQVSQLSKQQTATEILVDEARALAPTAYTAAPDCHILRKTSKGCSPQSAVLLLSDCHVGAVVRP